MRLIITALALGLPLVEGRPLALISNPERDDTSAAEPPTPTEAVASESDGPDITPRAVALPDYARLNSDGIIQQASNLWHETTRLPAFTDYGGLQVFHRAAIVDRTRADCVSRNEVEQGIASHASRLWNRAVPIVTLAPADDDEVIDYSKAVVLEPVQVAEASTAFTASTTSMASTTNGTAWLDGVFDIIEEAVPTGVPSSTTPTQPVAAEASSTVDTETTHEPTLEKRRSMDVKDYPFNPWNNEATTTTVYDVWYMPTPHTMTAPPQSPGDAYTVIVQTPPEAEEWTRSRWLAKLPHHTTMTKSKKKEKYKKVPNTRYGVYKRDTPEETYVPEDTEAPAPEARDAKKKKNKKQKNKKQKNKKKKKKKPTEASTTTVLPDGAVVSLPIGPKTSKIPFKDIEESWKKLEKMAQTTSTPTPTPAFVPTSAQAPVSTWTSPTASTSSDSFESIPTTFVPIWPKQTLTLPQGNLDRLTFTRDPVHSIAATDTLSEASTFDLAPPQNSSSPSTEVSSSESSTSTGLSVDVPEAELPLSVTAKLSTTSTGLLVGIPEAELALTTTTTPSTTISTSAIPTTIPTVLSVDIPKAELPLVTTTTTVSSFITSTTTSTGLSVDVPEDKVPLISILKLSTTISSSATPMTTSAGLLVDVPEIELPLTTTTKPLTTVSSSTTPTTTSAEEVLDLGKARTNFPSLGQSSTSAELSKTTASSSTSASTQILKVPIVDGTASDSAKTRSSILGTQTSNVVLIDSAPTQASSASVGAVPTGVRVPLKRSGGALTGHMLMQGVPPIPEGENEGLFSEEYKEKNKDDPEEIDPHDGKLGGGWPSEIFEPLRNLAGEGDDEKEDDKDKPEEQQGKEDENGEDKKDDNDDDEDPSILDRVKDIFD